jgi:hypothetical protein
LRRVYKRVNQRNHAQKWSRCHMAEAPVLPGISELMAAIFVQIMVAQDYVVFECVAGMLSKSHSKFC